MKGRRKPENMVPDSSLQNKVQKREKKMQGNSKSIRQDY